MASAFLAKTLLRLMSAKTSHVMADPPNETEAIAAPHTDPRPTRWMMLRGKLKAYRPQDGLGQEEPHEQEHTSVPKPMHQDGREQVSRAEHRKTQHDAQH